MAERDDRLLHDDELRFVDVLLDELLGPPPRAAVQPSPPVRRGGRLLAAALLLLGLGVLCATAFLVREPVVPLQDPVRPPPADLPLPPADLRAEAQAALQRLSASSNTLEPLADVVLGDDDPARGLTNWGPIRAAAASPRIVDPRDPWARSEPGRTSFRPERGAPVTDPRVTAPGTPALGLLRDVLPGRGGPATAARVVDPSQLADEPGHLQRLECGGGEPAAVAAAVRRFPGLRWVVLGAVLDDEVAAALSGCRGLEELEAEAVDVGSAGITALAGLPALRSLTLGGELGRDGAAALAGLSRLQRLRLAAPWPGDPAALLGVVRRMPALSELQCRLTAMPTAVAWADALVALPDLRHLGVVVDEGSLAALARVAATLPLASLRLGGGDLATADLQLLVRSPALRRLDLRGAMFAEPEAAATALASARQLTWLGLAFTNVGAERRLGLWDALPDCRHEAETTLTRPDGTLRYALHEHQRVATRR
jgi:hypothetical protein